jgi:predicted ABC-type ATPase
MQELIILGGANGSGKTTFSKQILAETGYKFLNADEIEKELSCSKLQAGKEFFRRLEKFLSTETSFVLESTLSGNYLVNAIKKAKSKGYSVKIIYVFLEKSTRLYSANKIAGKIGWAFYTR